MALTKQDLKLIKDVLAPQFEKIDKAIERNAELIQTNAKTIKNNRIEAKQDLEKLKAKFIKK